MLECDRQKVCPITFLVSPQNILKPTASWIMLRLSTDQSHSLGLHGHLYSLSIRFSNLIHITYHFYRKMNI